MKNWTIVSIVVLITVGPILYGNLIVQRGGILDDAILNTKDPYYMMDQRVRALASEGLKTGEQVTLVIPFSGTVTKDDLSFVIDFTEKLQAAFPEMGVLSLSSTAHYRDSEGWIYNDPFITREILSDPAFDLDSWTKQVRQNENAFGLLVSRKFDCAYVILLVPQGADEITTFWRVTELVEGREISWLERFFKPDIYPNEDFSRVLGAGWLLARGLMDAALTCDVLKLVTFGLLMTWVLFVIQLICLRQACIATMMVALSFWWTRGSIGLLQLMGVPVYERVYILLVFAVQIVAGISFCEHKFARYQEVRRAHPELSPMEVWRLTLDVNELILVTGIISILNFATLYQIGVRGITEVGALSVIGLTALLALTLWFMPTIHRIVGGEAQDKNPARISVWWEKFLDFISIAICYLLTVRQGQKFRPYRCAVVSLVTVVVFVSVAANLVLSDQLIVRSNPLEYIKDTWVYRACMYLQEEGRYGIDRIASVVRPKVVDNAESAIIQPDFIAEVAQFQQELAVQPSFREVNSVVNTLRTIARESYHEVLPQTKQQVYDSLAMVELDNPLIKEQLWYDGGLVVFASTDSMTDSNLMGQSCDAIVQLAQERFPSLEVLPFGKVPAYPRVDKYIREGKPVNMLTSQVIVILIYIVWLGWRNRRDRLSNTLGSCRTGLAMSLPFIFATAVIAIIMVRWGIPLDQVTACITPLAINAAADFGIHPMFECRRLLGQGLDMEEAMRRAIETKGKIVLNDICLNILCFAPLTCSSFIPVQRLGWIMIVMMILCGIGSLVFLMATLPLCVNKRKKIVKKLTFLLFVVLIGTTGWTAELSGEEIIAKAFELYRQAPSEREETTVTITPDGSRPTSKVFTRWILFDSAGEDKVAVKFSKPVMDNGLGLLVWRHNGRADEQWLKMPSFNRTRKISVSDQSKYFGGTDITFEDARQLIGERTQDFDYEILRSSEKGWEIEALPKSGVKTGYGERIFSIRPDFACTAVEYYDTRGELLKEQKNHEITIQANGMWRADEVVIANCLLKRTTKLVTTEREFGSVDSGKFTQDFLLRKE